MANTNIGPWAKQEFGLAEIGDERRRRRLVKIAAQAARRPAGRITAVFSQEAARRGAFRLMGHEEVEPGQIADAAHRACARRAMGAEFVFVPVDGSSLNLADWSRSKGLGVVGARSIGARGLQVLSAIAIAPDGTPLGICGQKWWARKGRVRKGKHDRRQLRSKETQYWLDVMDSVRDVLAIETPSTKPWFQLDRGGDAWPVVLDGLGPHQLFTVRAAQDRRLRSETDEPRRYLWETLEGQLPLGRYDLAVPARPGRSARTAHIAVRACVVTLDLLDARTKKRWPATLWAVLAREEKTVPKGEEAIEWLLLTTYPAHTLADAKLVLQGYAQRWRIEEFHRAWKSGACRVEETQLRDYDSILRWATILASVAMRIVRMTYLARTRPDTPATAEFSQTEINAMIAIEQPADYRPGEVPSISRVVRWLANIGGYTGKSSGGPPGAIVIARGLDRIQVLVDFLTHRGQEEM